jgi:hypothetical protein
MPDRSTAGDFAEEVGGEALEFALDLVGAAVPGTGVLGRRLLSKVREERTRRQSRALKIAELRSGLSREDLAEKIAEESQLVPLVTRLLHAAGMNGHDQTLDALGAAFGRAVAEPDSRDECELILVALADLTEDHTRTLLRLTEEPPKLTGTANVWTPDLLVNSGGLSPRTAALCLAAVVARGLVENPTGFGGLTVLRVTALGFEVLAVLREYADGYEEG